MSTPEPVPVGHLFVVPESEASTVRIVGRHLLTGVMVFGVLAVLGVAAGAVWHLVAPRTELVVTDHVAYYVSPSPGAPVAADGWYAVIALVAGVCCGSLAHGLFHRRLVGASLGLAFGGVAGSLVAWKVGHWFGGAAYTQAVHTATDGTHLFAPLDLRALGVLVLWPLAATLTVFVGVAAEELQRRRERARARRARAAQERFELTVGREDATGHE